MNVIKPTVQHYFIDSSIYEDSEEEYILDDFEMSEDSSNEEKSEFFTEFKQKFLHEIIVPPRELKGHSQLFSVPVFEEETIFEEEFGLEERLSKSCPFEVEKEILENENNFFDDENDVFEFENDLDEIICDFNFNNKNNQHFNNFMFSFN